jgi:hypothetical protein
MTTDQDPWDDVDQRPEALRRLGPSGEPPAELEDRVVRTLQIRGVIAVPLGSAWLRRWALPAAAALAALAVGFGLGRRTVPPAAVTSPRYALLLYEDSSFQPPPPGDQARYVAEYSRWATEVNAAGNGLTGEELSVRGRTIEPGGEATDHDQITEGGSVLSGFFIVHATDLERATAIAKTCPHLKHGGRVVIRPIEPT